MFLKGATGGGVVVIRGRVYCLVDIVNKVMHLRQGKQFSTPNEDGAPIQVFEDDQGAIKLFNKPMSSKRTRHMDVKHHFIRDALLEKKVYTGHIGTEYQNADNLTKPLNAKLFEKYVGAE